MISASKSTTKSVELSTFKPNSSRTTSKSKREKKQSINYDSN